MLPAGSGPGPTHSQVLPEPGAEPLEPLPSRPQGCASGLFAERGGGLCCLSPLFLACACVLRMQIRDQSC